MSAETISNSMMYKYAMSKGNNPLYIDNPVAEGDMDNFVVPEMEGEIPEEWIQNWWYNKLDKVPVGDVSLERMFEGQRETDDEDLYG